MFKNNKKENPTSGVQFQKIENGIIPNFSYLEHKIKSQLPIGCIIPWLGGYFTATDNVGYTCILGGTNDVLGTNSYINPKGWDVCDGTPKIDMQSPIFNGINRFLPELITNYFISSGIVLGASGGDNYFLDHIHNLYSITTNQISFSSSSNNKHYHRGRITTDTIGAHTHRVPSHDDADNSWHCFAPGKKDEEEAEVRKTRDFANCDDEDGTDHSNISISMGSQSVLIDYSHNHGATASHISTTIDATDPIPTSILKIVKNLSCFMIMRIK